LEILKECFELFFQKGAPSCPKGRLRTGIGDRMQQRFFIITFPCREQITMTILANKYILILIILSILTASAYPLPSYKEVRKSYNKSDTLLVDRHSEPLYEVRTNQMLRRLDWTSLRDISPALLLAVIYAEDKRFFDHSGVDYLSMGAAIARGMDSETVRGASTITMQLVSILNKNLEPRKGRRTIWQKGQQILEARSIEKKWTKGEILEAYLNLISFRGELQGICAASRGLFGKAPHGLNHAESLILASLIRSPNARPSDLAMRASLLRKVLSWPEDDNETEVLAAQTAHTPASLQPIASLAPHAARLLVRKSSIGKTVTCTLDRKLQHFALECLKDQIGSLGRQNVANGAILIVENKTGEVLAYVSYTSDPSHNRFVDGVRAKRQAGSTLKPFLYGLAFEKKILTPASLLEDSPLDMHVFSGIYRPNNYEADFKGLVTSRVALASSLNIPAVRTLSLVGLESFLARLRRLGIKGLTESGDYYGPSLALGSIDVSLWELTNAYRCLANDGVLGELTLSFKANTHSHAKRIFSCESSFLISDILSDREARSPTFGLENPLSTRFWTAVKTGTSKDMRDNWCVGYSHKYTVGVWVGNFSGEAMWDVSGISGAAPVWIELMNRLHNKESIPNKQTTPMITVKKIGFLQTPEASRTELFINGTEPNEKNQKIGQLNQRIIYPPSGTIIALDPDIPPDLQKVFFLSQPQTANQQWLLNKQPVIETSGSLSCWTPQAGAYTLTLYDEEGRSVDSIHFEVRGSAIAEVANKQKNDTEKQFTQ
jgi:penicillin-binding protein 1C